MICNISKQTVANVQYLITIPPFLVTGYRCTVLILIILEDQ